MIAVVTGASSGIGQATAREIAGHEGWELVLVARREDRLRALAEELGGATAVAADLVEEGAPARVREALEREHGGQVHLLVNNAGASWGSVFSDGGFDNVKRTMALNFDAVVRLTEELLPLLKASAPSSIVNVSSVAGRVAGGPRSGAYSASKFALAGWTDALHLELRRDRVHVGLVLPGYVATEGMPQEELRRRALTRWIVSTPDKVAKAIWAAGPGGKAERFVPRPYWLAAAARAVLPGVTRRARY
jgi:short-subunit dehydrogenase